MIVLLVSTMMIFTARLVQLDVPLVFRILLVLPALLTIIRWEICVSLIALMIPIKKVLIAYLVHKLAQVAMDHPIQNASAATI